MLVDTHCHIHEADFPLDVTAVLDRAKESGVEKLICVGTNEESSARAIEFAEQHEGVYAAVGVHPHDAKGGYKGILAILAGAAPPDATRTSPRDRRLVAVGEIGLDYHYLNSPRETQIAAFEAQLDAAVKANLPVIFHVRAAFDDFWPILDNFQGLRGVLHSFTDTVANMDEGLRRGFYIGVNGISTFTKDPDQRKMFKAIPLEKMLLETDAPFLTPKPFRGRVNESAYIGEVAKHQALVRGLAIAQIAAITTRNATELFVL